MKLKRLYIFGLALGMCLAMTGCGNDNKNNDNLPVDDVMLVDENKEDNESNNDDSTNTEYIDEASEEEMIYNDGLDEIKQNLSNYFNNYVVNMVDNDKSYLIKHEDSYIMLSNSNELEDGNSYVNILNGAIDDNYEYLYSNEGRWLKTELDKDKSEIYNIIDSIMAYSDYENYSDFELKSYDKLNDVLVISSKYSDESVEFTLDKKNGNFYMSINNDKSLSFFSADGYVMTKPFDLDQEIELVDSVLFNDIMTSQLEFSLY